MKFYTVAGSCSLASHIALAEAGVDYEVVRLSFATSDQRSPDYLAVNPKGRVPALATDRGVLTETPAILAYIAQTAAPALALLDDPFTFAQVQAFNLYLAATVHVAHAHKQRGARWTDDPAAIESFQHKLPDSMRDVCLPIEHGMLAGPWVMGERYTVCDGYLFTLGRWLDGDRVDMSLFPRILDHRARMEQRPAVQRALKEQG